MKYLLCSGNNVNNESTTHSTCCHILSVMLSALATPPPSLAWFGWVDSFNMLCLNVYVCVCVCVCASLAATFAFSALLYLLTFWPRGRTICMIIALMRLIYHLIMGHKCPKPIYVDLILSILYYLLHYIYYYYFIVFM